MKDMPALLLAALSVTSSQHLKKVFGRVIDNGRMLRNFVQILRSGTVGRKSLGSVPKSLVQGWLNEVSERKLIEASVGTEPSLRDIVRMVHPKPKDAGREALYGWLLGKPVAAERLPAAVQDFVRYQSERSQEVPDVPFQMLTALGLKAEGWAQVALRGGWQLVRMNLNTFARHGVFEIDGIAERIAAKLVERDAIERARVFPYQLMVAYQSLDREQVVRDVEVNPRDSVITNAQKLASIGGGGTNCSAPLARLKNHNLCPDLVILISDNESWVDARASGPTQMMGVWENWVECIEAVEL